MSLAEESGMYLQEVVGHILSSLIYCNSRVCVCVTRQQDY
jgi:hypothetical protein